ncbi:DDE-type integrase/transposase/recombinase, partial [Zunongwangia sp. F363]
MNQLYKSVGISKQAVHSYAKRQAVFDDQLMQLMEEADELRREHPGCGVEKMYHTLNPDFIGRDRFVETFMQLGYRLKKKKNYRRTTIAGKVYYPNLIKGKQINGPCVVWQSDITYYKVAGKFYYAVFIIDVYTKKIVGYQVSDHMRATANMKAMKMALKGNDAPQIHHSDRGSQYTYKKYIDLLKAHSTAISMALSAQDNAYAERINRTIKEEYLDYWEPGSFN